MYFWYWGAPSLYACDWICPQNPLSFLIINLGVSCLATVFSLFTILKTMCVFYLNFQRNTTLNIPFEGSLWSEECCWLAAHLHTSIHILYIPPYSHDGLTFEVNTTTRGYSTSFSVCIYVYRRFVLILLISKKVWAI